MSAIRGVEPPARRYLEGGVKDGRSDIVSLAYGEDDRKGTKYETRDRGEGGRIAACEADQ